MTSITEGRNTCSVSSLGAVPKNCSQDQTCLCLDTVKEMKDEEDSILITGCGQVVHFTCLKEWVNFEDGRPNLDHQKCPYCLGDYIKAVKMGSEVVHKEDKLEQVIDYTAQRVSEIALEVKPFIFSTLDSVRSLLGIEIAC
ncbi:MAG: hypothetical protein S4CHLAM6_04960 [Chlamydiae bacterium]|nr:hypothetical protein [Chlamydiota bacterium]